MIITPQALRGIYTAFNTVFNKAFEGQHPTYEKVATVVPSTSESETYAWLGDIPGMREWIGEREIQNLSGSAYPRCGEIVCGVWPHIVSEGHLVASTVMAQGGASGGGNPFPRAGTFAASEEFYHFGAYTIYQGFASDIEAGSKAAQGAKVYLRCSTSTRCSTNAKGGAAE